MNSEADIIIFTQFYPFTSFDTYFEEELFEIAKHFRRVVLISADPDSDILRPVPSNTVFFRFRPKGSAQRKLKILKYLFSTTFWQELYHVRRVITLKNFLLIQWYAMSALDQAAQCEAYIQSLIRKEIISGTSLTIYSYWMLESAFAAGVLKKKIPGTKVIARAHGSDLYFHRSPIGYLPLKKLTFDLCDAIYFISERGRNYFKTFHSINETESYKLRVARLGIPAAKQLPPPSPVGAPFKIVSNAFIQPIKRVDLIAQALREIHDLKIEWTHFGDVYNNPEGFEIFKQQTTDMLKSNPNISFHFAGMVSNDTILNFYRNNFADLFINVSTTEGIPVSIMEAISFGIPVIATDAGGNSEIVNDKNGKLLPVHLTATDLAEAIKLFFRQPVSERDKFRAGAFSTWKEKFDAAVNYPEFVNEILSLETKGKP